MGTRASSAVELFERSKCSASTRTPALACPHWATILLAYLGLRLLSGPVATGPWASETGLLLANMRSIFISLAIVMGAAFLVPGLVGRKSRLLSVVATLVLAIVLACSFALLFFHLQAGRDFATRVSDELDSAVFHTGDDPYWQFRLAAWSEAWRRFEKYPPGGEGFGIPFVFEIWDNDARPHNTFLTVLYKMGLLGFLPLLVFLAYFFWLGLRAVYRNSANRRVAFLEIVILAQFSFCVYGGAFPVFESPYAASLFWAGMGIGLRIIKNFDLERSLRALQTVLGAMPEV